MSSLEILQRMREILEEPQRWCKLARHSDHDRHCIVGAYEIAVFGKEPSRTEVLSSNTYQATTELLFGPNGPDAANWNDNWARTHEDVIAQLDKRIKELS